MAHAQNRYLADLRDFQFLLFEQFPLADILKQQPDGMGVDDARMVLDEVYGFSKEILGPLDAVGDAQGCRVENGEVRTPEGFKQAWKALYEAGWRTLAVEEKHGGQAGPFTLAMLVVAPLSGYIAVRLLERQEALWRESRAFFLLRRRQRIAVELRERRAEAGRQIETLVELWLEAQAFAPDSRRA